MGPSLDNQKNMDYQVSDNQGLKLSVIILGAYDMPYLYH